MSVARYPDGYWTHMGKCTRRGGTYADSDARIENPAIQESGSPASTHASRESEG